MEINITLILQALQFGCAYCFLYRFLFAPACKILSENERFKDELYQKLEQEQQVKDALLQDYHVKSNAFKNVLIEAIPELSTQSISQESVPGPALYCVEEPTLSSKDRKEIESFLVDHLSQVRKK